MPAPWPSEFAERLNAMEKMLSQHGTDIARLWKRVHQTPQEYTGWPHGWVDNPTVDPPVVELPPVVTTTPGEATTTAEGSTTTPGDDPPFTTTTTPEATTTEEATTTGATTTGATTTGATTTGGGTTTTPESTTTTTGSGTTTTGGGTTTTTAEATTTTTTPEVTTTTTPEVTTTTAEATTTAEPTTTAAPTTTPDPGSGPNSCAECNLPNTLYVRRASDDALIDTLSYGTGCNWTGATCGFGYGFVPGQGNTWYLDCTNEPGGTQEYQAALDSCVGTLMTDGGAYYIADS